MIVKHNPNLVDTCEDGLGPVIVALWWAIAAGYLPFRMTSILKPGYNSDRALYFSKSQTFGLLHERIWLGIVRAASAVWCWMDWADKTMWSLMMTVTTGVHSETLTRRVDVLATMQRTS